jgi:nitrite reductase/ring-hydroxylating ferredoxin subunit
MTTKINKSFLEENKLTKIIHDNKEILLYLNQDKVFAFDNECSHENLPLEDADIENNNIRCCYHNAEFDMCTGQPTADDITDKPLTTYNAEIIDDQILINNH